MKDKKAPDTVVEEKKMRLTMWNEVFKSCFLNRKTRTKVETNRQNLAKVMFYESKLRFQTP